MGSKPTDSGTMKTASAGAQASDQALADQAKQNTLFSSQARGTQFGADGKSGTLGGFLDPSTMNADHPTGSYGLQYKRFLQQNAQNGEQARGSISRTLAQRGFGDHPSGIAADEFRKQAQGQADTAGSGFVDYTDKSHQEALGNFWRANDALSGQGSGAMSAAIAGNQAAAGNYANLYNTASTPVPSAMGAIIGGGLSAAGNVGAAAVKCPVEGSTILLFDGSEIAVEHVITGMLIRGKDGQPCPVLEDPEPILVDAVEVISPVGSVQVSSSHTFSLANGGYEYSPHVAGRSLEFGDSVIEPSDVKSIGQQKVYPLVIGGSHTYRVNGFWSLS